MMEFEFLGNYSAVDPAYSRQMYCYDCITTWIGCWDNFQCPKCGEGELPDSAIVSTDRFKKALQKPGEETK